MKFLKFIKIYHSVYLNQILGYSFIHYTVPTSALEWLVTLWTSDPSDQWPFGPVTSNPKHNLSKLQHYDTSITVGAETIQPVNLVRNLGMWLTTNCLWSSTSPKSPETVFFSAQTSTTNSTTCRAGGHHTLSLCVGAIQIGLLQLNPGWFASMHSQHIAKGPERSCSPHLSTEAT